MNIFTGRVQDSSGSGSWYQEKTIQLMRSRWKENDKWEVFGRIHSTNGIYNIWNTYLISRHKDKKIKWLFKVLNETLCFLPLKYRNNHIVFVNTELHILTHAQITINATKTIVEEIQTFSRNTDDFLFKKNNKRTFRGDWLSGCVSTYILYIPKDKRGLRQFETSPFIPYFFNRLIL